MKTETFIVAGTHFYEDGIRSLMIPNEDFNLSKKELLEQFSTYELIPEYYPANNHVLLEPEPDNRYDPNAIKVLISNVLVGYIKKGSCVHVKKLLQQKNVSVVATEVQVGRYKKIYEDTVESDAFKGPFIRIAISYGEEEPAPVQEEVIAPEAPKASEAPKEEKPDRAGKLKRIKRSLIIVAVFAWIVTSALCHLIEPALVIGIIFIFVVSEIFKRLK